jgi:GTP cyclohydrolase IA
MLKFLKGIKNNNFRTITAEPLGNKTIINIVLEIMKTNNISINDIMANEPDGFIQKQRIEKGSVIQNIEEATSILLHFIGEDRKRPGLLETPNRVAKAWMEWTSGYGQSAEKILKVFEDGAENYDQMVTVKDIPFYSHCEHHLAPFFGTCTISYIPDGKIVGLSKLSRLTQMYAKRLQVQERLTNQIAEALYKHLQPLGVGVSIKARHLCMESRGTCQQGHHTVTTSLKGCILTDPSAKAEFLRGL